MEKPSYYAILPAKVRYDKKLKANSKIIYSEITSLSNKNGECWASNSYFAKLYDVDSSTVSRWINDLEEHGYITLKYIYKENSEAVDKRIIILNEVLQNCNRVLQKDQGGYCKKIKENNTSINNKKEEEEKTEKLSTNDLKNVIEFYEENITLITPYIAEDIEKYLEEGLEAELIIECMKEAVSRNRRNWKYIVSILNDCCNNNIKNSKQFKIKQEEFKNNKNSTKKYLKPKEKIEYTEIEMTEEEYEKRMNEEGKKYG